jgi:isocitrate/isopropylmalate dehydrogenase
MAAILTIGLLLANEGHQALAERVEAAVETAILGGHMTADLGGSLTTEQVGERICEIIATGPVPPEPDRTVGV